MKNLNIKINKVFENINITINESITLNFNLDLVSKDEDTLVDFVKNFIKKIGSTDTEFSEKRCPCNSR